MTGFPSIAGLPAADPTFVRGWEQCRKALSGSDLVSDIARAGLVPESSNNLLLLDGDVHQQVRHLLAAHFARVRLDTLVERLEETCDALVQSLVGRSNIDLVADLAEPVVLEGIMSVMEIPTSRRPILADLVRRMLGLLEPELPSPARRDAAKAALQATMLFERDGQAGKATGLHARLEAAARAGVIPTKLASTTPVVVLHGGYENPLNQLGCLIAWAVENPDRFRDAALSAPNVLFEEIMRVYSPVRRIARWAASDGECAGLPLKRGESVWVDLESANFDDGQFAAASDLDFSKERRHLGFGYGRHMCPGGTLARLEGQVLIRALLRIRVETFSDFAVEWRDAGVARGPLKIARRSNVV